MTTFETATNVCIVLFAKYGGNVKKKNELTKGLIEHNDKVWDKDIKFLSCCEKRIKKIMIIFISLFD